MGRPQVFRFAPPASWEVVGQGGQSIVLRSPHVPGFVLRLRKCRIGKPGGSESVIESHRFQSEVIVPLLGQFVDPGVLVSLDVPNSSLEELSQRLASFFAPTETLDTTTTVGVLLIDAVGSVGRSLEIKPKVTATAKLAETSSPPTAVPALPTRCYTCASLPLRAVVAACGSASAAADSVPLSSLPFGVGEALAEGHTSPPPTLPPLSVDRIVAARPCLRSLTAGPPPSGAFVLSKALTRAPTELDASIGAGGSARWLTPPQPSPLSLPSSSPHPPQCDTPSGGGVCVCGVARAVAAALHTPVELSVMSQCVVREQCAAGGAWGCLAQQCLRIFNVHQSRDGGGGGVDGGGGGGAVSHSAPTVGYAALSAIPPTSLASLLQLRIADLNRGVGAHEVVSVAAQSAQSPLQVACCGGGEGRSGGACCWRYEGGGDPLVGTGEGVALAPGLCASQTERGGGGAVVHTPCAACGAAVTASLCVGGSLRDCSILACAARGSAPFPIPHSFISDDVREMDGGGDLLETLQRHYTAYAPVAVEVRLPSMEEACTACTDPLPSGDIWTVQLRVVDVDFKPPKRLAGWATREAAWSVVEKWGVAVPPCVN